ncbi:hypothetical protein KC352_g30400, partial [Hortaea werneckii]
MADQEPEVTMAGDEEMAESTDVPGGEETVVEPTGDDEPTGLGDIEPETPERLTFLDYLRSPIIQLVVGNGGNASTLSVHQALLVQSPHFAEAVSRFTDAAQARRIELPNDDLNATSSVLEYLYKGDYFPTLQGAQTMEYDPTVPSPDNDGVALLRHARVYTLAQRFHLPALSALAHKKIHLTQSTAKGEIAYA